MQVDGEEKKDKVEGSKDTESRIKDEEERIDSKTIHFIAKSIGSEWSEVALCLGFSSAQRDHLTENYRNFFEKIESMISCWLREVKCKEIPNPRRLLANCIANVNKDLAYKIHRKFEEATLPKDFESSIQEIIIGKHHQQEDQQKVQQTCQECKRNVKEEDDVMKNKHSEKRRRTIESKDQDVEDDVIQNKQSKKRRRTEESEDQESVKPGSSCDEPKSVDDQKKEILYTIDDIPSKVQKIESSENEEKQALNLRQYQHELAKIAIQGKNDLILAPTGSGKTHVAIKIIQAHLDKKEVKRKVAFLVDKTALAKQQCRQMRNYLSYTVKEITGNTQKTEQIDTVSMWLKKKDILVMTAQILVNALESGSVAVSDFSLLVFDECHHATQNHAYNQILHRYLDVKLSGQSSLSLPQIVGLTASVGGGKPKNLESAIKCVKTLMANLDAGHISTVRKNKEELIRFSVKPEEVICMTPNRDVKLFGDKIQQLMKEIENYMINTPYIARYPRLKEILMRSVPKGADFYAQWLGDVDKQISFTNEPSARKCFFTCHYFLEVYHKTLIVYEGARVKDAITFLKQKIKEWDENSKEDKTTEMIKQAYNDCKHKLEDWSKDPLQENPKLIKLRDTLLKSQPENGNMRAIVFVKTRDLASNLESWMKETPELAHFNPSKFVGTNQNTSNGGLTKLDQSTILDLFREGGHKLIIATSVAEEGLDIPTCNSVIRYDHVTNEISMVQSKGRCRAKDGTYTVIAGEEGNTENKESINIEREALLKQAIEELQSKIDDNHKYLLDELYSIQQKEKDTRDTKPVTNDYKSVSEDLYKIQCKRCHQELCESSDLRKILGAHHVAINPDIRNKIIVKENTEGYGDSDIKFDAKLSCKSCLFEVGTECTFRQKQYPVLSSKSISFVDKSTGKISSFKKWKQFNLFFIPNLD